MTLLLGSVAILAVVLVFLHRQAAARMLTVDPDAPESGILSLAQEARPVFAASEIVVVALAVLLVRALTSGGVVWAGLLAVVLVTALLFPVPPARPASRPSGFVRALGRFLGAGRSETSSATAPATRGGALETLDERVLVQRMLRFQEQKIDEVMVPRSEVVAIARTASVRDLLGLLDRERHSRYPVFDEDLDHVAGFVHVFDLARLEPGDTSFEALIRAVQIVPEGKGAAELLGEMLAANDPFALVVDEFGGTAGILTVEDLVEQLVGEIWDEHEVESVVLRRVGRNVWVTKATIPVGELAERLDIRLPEGDYETLAGFLLESFGRIPLRGESVPFEDVTFEVLKADRRRIDAVQITRESGRAPR